MTNFPGPPTWASVTSYTQNQSEVYGSNGFYYVCTTSGTSGSVQPTWASVFGTTQTDGTVTWVCAQRSRQPWAAAKTYTAGLPYTTTASVTSLGGSLRNVPVAQFIPIGAYVVSSSLVPLNHQYGNVTAVDVAGSVVSTSSLGNVSGAGKTVVFNQYQYPWPDQIVTGTSGSPVAQCIISGVSGSVQPVWPTTIGASVTDGSAAWATVAIN